MFGSQLRKNGSSSAKTPSNGRYRNGNDHLIELHDVVKTYRSAAGEFTALKGIDLEVDGGEFVAVIGKIGQWQINAGQHDHRHRPPHLG